MKVLFDTNVVVSAILKDRTPEEVILFVVSTPEFAWIASVDIVEEYLDVLRRPKFDLPPTLIQQWEATFLSMITLLDVPKTLSFPPDQKDAKFLECALAAHAEYLVTGDKDFEQAYKLVTTTVLSAAQFKSIVCENWR